MLVGLAPSAMKHNMRPLCVTSVRACVRGCVRGCVRVRVRVCVFTCVCACAACMRVWARV